MYVLIVGAGPTGLTLACELRRRGVSFRLIEAAAEPATGSRGKGLQPRTLEVFDDMGIVDEIVATAALYPKFRTHLGPLSLRAGSLGTRRPATPETPYPNMLMLSQATTEDILRRRLRSLGGSEERGVGLVAVERNDPDGVDVLLSTGERAHADHVVGCDGGRSSVRKSLGLELNGEQLDHGESVVADVEIPTLDRTDWHVWPLGGVLTLCPLPSTKLFQLTASLAIDDLPSVVERRTGHRVSHVHWVSRYRPQARMVNRYRVGQVFVAGDAAHVHPPAGGQGLNTGVQDAYNLGWKLAYVAHGASPSLLDTYETERLPIAAAMLGLSKRLHVQRSIKRGDATNQLSLHYADSPLSSGATTHMLKPGQRMPADGRWFEQRRKQTGSILYRADTTYLVRPDGYVAHVGDDWQSSPFAAYDASPAVIE